MSKGNMLQGQARGKVGDLVFFVRNGIQQTRVRNRQPGNPRTVSQMFQRVKLAAVVGFYKRQASFFRFALKKAQKESYYNAFVRYNLNISPYLTKEQAANGITIPAPYIIADGNMPRIDVRDANVTGLTVLDLTTSISSSIMTWGDMRRAYGLVMGDMLTLVVFNAPDDDAAPSQRIVVQHRFDAESENMPIGYDMVGTDWSTDGEHVQVAVDATYFGLTEFFATGSAIILSRNNGAVDCSYAQLELDANAMFNYQEFRTEAQRDMAALSYGQETNAILDPKQFEGNYVDMAKLYYTSEHVTEVDSVSMKLDESTNLYYDNSKWPSITNVSFEKLSGASNVEDMSVLSTGVMEITSSATVVGSASYKLSFTDDNDNLIALSYLTINVTE